MLKTGQKIIVKKPEGDTTGWTEAMDKFDGMETKVSRHRNHSFRVVTKGGGGCNKYINYYELKGAVSDTGKVPFGFMEEWLTKI